MPWKMMGRQRRFDDSFHGVSLALGLQLGIEHHPQGKEPGRQRDADEEHDPGVLSIAFLLWAAFALLTTRIEFAIFTTRHQATEL